MLNDICVLGVNVYITVMEHVMAGVRLQMAVSLPYSPFAITLSTQALRLSIKIIIPHIHSELRVQNLKSRPRFRNKTKQESNNRNKTKMQ